MIWPIESSIRIFHRGDQQENDGCPAGAGKAPNGKYLILKDPSLADIFWVRNQELNQNLQELKNARFPGTAKTLPQVAALATKYGVYF